MAASRPQASANIAIGFVPAHSLVAGMGGHRVPADGSPDGLGRPNGLICKTLTLPASDKVFRRGRTMALRLEPERLRACRPGQIPFRTDAAVPPRLTVTAPFGIIDSAAPLIAWTAPASGIARGRMGCSGTRLRHGGKPARKPLKVAAVTLADRMVRAVRAMPGTGADRREA